MKRDIPPEVDLGKLSPDEAHMLESRDEAYHELRKRLEDAFHGAHEMREFRESLVRRHVSVSGVDMQLIEDYAEAKAREILAREKLEACGWPL